MTTTWRQQFEHNPFPVFPSVARFLLTDYGHCTFFKQRSRAGEMTDTDGPAGQELCVLYREAIDWIAFRNFKGVDRKVLLLAVNLQLKSLFEQTPHHFRELRHRASRRQSGVDIEPVGSDPVRP